MSKIIEFQPRSNPISGQLAEIRPLPEDRLVAGQADLETDQDDIERHWGVAVALASWPICLGAGAVWMVL
ncbi:hypothetical protein ACFSE1_06495 [Rhizobium helianthi]|uniref:Uncharacterized protein n=1 Tax=Rhizobium helianthi TaxID=1132695 RepID=A0ABW4M1F9_9HYPH